MFIVTDHCSVSKVVQQIDQIKIRKPGKKNKKLKIHQISENKTTGELHGFSLRDCIWAWVCLLVCIRPQSIQCYGSSPA